jgi:hypothetical protein
MKIKTLPNAKLYGMKPNRLTALMNQGKGPAPRVNKKADLAGLFGQGTSPSCSYDEPGKVGVRKFMNQ